MRSNPLSFRGLIFRCPHMPRNFEERTGVPVLDIKSTGFDIDKFILRWFGIRIAKVPLGLMLRSRSVLAK